ncbi:MAG TPA: universal stress protein, partial [Promineifilum sp.]|nr:universal stress protein [Promineifilum sp.]
MMDEQLQANNPAEQPELWTIRRILVALDASANSRAALATAVNLAALLRSEVHGLFVEDINLVRLAELPFVREVLFASPTLRQLEREELQRKLRARAAVLRHELEVLTDEHKVPGHFRVIRGAVERELLAAATEMEADLLAVGRLGHSIGRRGGLGSTARAVVTRAVSAVLLVRTDVGSGPIVVLYDGSATGRGALSLAARLTGPSGDLRVLVWGPDEDEALERRQ